MESVVYLAIALLGNISFELVVWKNCVHCLSTWLSLPMFANFKLFWTLVPRPKWQMLMDSVLIPDEWMAMAYARLTELTVQELEVS